MPYEPELKKQFEDLFRAQARAVYAFCFQVLQDRDEAHLVAGNFWRRLYSRIPEFDLPNDRLLFLRLLAREVIEFMHYEKACDPSEHRDTDELEQMDWSAIEVSEILERQRHARAREVLRKLLPRQRLALVLRFQLDCATVDIARVLSCTVETARAYLHSGLIAYRYAMRTMEQSQ